jgi:membrane-associated protease RseP (regulator of RpoE activity)
MQPEPQRIKPPAKSTGAEETTTCPNCRALMPRQMRFCRACGFRLGEGLAEYVETVRLPNQPKAAHPPRAATVPPAQPQAAPPGVRDYGPLAHNATWQALNQTVSQVDQWKKKKGRRHMHWIIWLMIALALGGITGRRLLRTFTPRTPTINVNAPDSHAGLDDIEDTKGGATFDKVAPPGGPADKAGLLGGDIITSFDGKPVTSADDLTNMLLKTPIGKTVDIIFTRDGETKTTKLTTISDDEEERLEDLADNRPEGEGYIAEGTNIDVVPVPGMNIKGVRLNNISENRPADIAGLKDGDIVIEFDGLPMRTRRELESRIVRALPGSTVKVVVIRGTERLEIPVKIGKG